MRDGSSAGSVHVLYVDDDEAMLDLTALSLERENDQLSVVTATCGHEGLERLSAADDHIDCVVSDFDMPEMDGLAFLERVRAEHGDLPFLLFTGKGSEEVASKAISAGVTDYIQKRPGREQFTLLANRIELAVSRTRAEVRASESEARAQTLLDASPHMLGVVLDAEYAYVNDAGADLLAAGNCDDVIGSTFLDTVHPEDRETVSSHIDSVRTGDRVANVDHRMVDLDDEIVDVETTVRPVVWSGRRAVLAVVRDITDRKRREQLLRETKRKYEELLEQLNSVVWLTDGNFDEVLYVNSAYADLWGRAPEAWYVNSMDYLEAIHPEDRKAVLREDRRIRDAAQGPPSEIHNEYHSEYRIVDANDTVRWMHQLAFPVRNEDGTIVRWAGITEDVTDRKRRERELVEKSNRLAEITGIVSHDLRNPVNIAQGHLELARATGADSHLDVVDNALERLAELIEESTTLARHARSPDDPSQCSLVSTAEAAWTTASTRDATLAVETDASVLADRGKLRSAFENLFNNAVRHGGDAVDVTVDRFVDGFYVEDTGPGIPAENRERVFEPGYSTADGGTGFGLAIVKEVADCHGWDVRIVDGSDGGARFEFVGAEAE